MTRAVALALAAWAGLGWAGLGHVRAAAGEQAVKLENAKVRVREVVHQPGVPRERHVRPADQIIVFLDDCEYQRTDPQTGGKTVRKRKAHDVIWHDKGEVAPELVNLGTKPYRTLVIELK